MTTVLASLLFLVHERVLDWVRRAPVVGGPLRPRTAAFVPDEARLVNHTIIVGYTPAGREVASALALRGFRFAVIDEDPATSSANSRPPAFPSSSATPKLPIILEQAGISGARVLAITLLDPGQVESVAATARQFNRRIDVIARGLTEESPQRLRRIGVGRVVQSEFEVGAQFVRHTLQRFGMTSQEVQALLLRMRQERLGE